MTLENYYFGARVLASVLVMLTGMWACTLLPDILVVWMGITAGVCLYAIWFAREREK